VAEQDFRNWTNVNVGRLSKDRAANIARECRIAIGRLSDVWPQGDSKQRGQMKVTLDQFGQYHFYLNHQALVCILLFMKDIENPLVKPHSDECPPNVPEFLRWGQPDLSSGSKPE
jgi:hypothetical protein